MPRSSSFLQIGKNEQNGNPFSVQLIKFNDITIQIKTKTVSKDVIMKEKLQDIKDLDAYVFLDAKNYIEPDFLANVNFYLKISY